MTAHQDAAQVLTEHQVHGIGPGCTCGWRVSVGATSLYQHQADMLAAAGLLVTPEHDAPALDAMRDCVNGVRHDSPPPYPHHPDGWCRECGPSAEDREALALARAAVEGPEPGPREVVPAAEYVRLARVALAARQPAPVDADHTVTAEWDGGYGGTTFTFHCHTGPESACHAVYDCACEEWTQYGVKDGRPSHEAYDRETDAEVRHYGTFDPYVCNLRDWFENTDGPMHGSLTFAVDAEYQGDYYLFRPTQGATRG